MMLLGFNGFIAMLVIVFGVINLLIYLKLKQNIERLNERSGMIFNFFLEHYADSAPGNDNMEKINQHTDKVPKV